MVTAVTNAYNNAEHVKIISSVSPVRKVDYLMETVYNSVLSHTFCKMVIVLSARKIAKNVKTIRHVLNVTSIITS